MFPIAAAALFALAGVGAMLYGSRALTADEPWFLVMFPVAVVWFLRSWKQLRTWRAGDDVDGRD